MYSASTALLEALTEAGVTHVFANFGSDHPALVEAIAEARTAGRTIPRIVTCPTEMVTLSCAHGFAQVQLQVVVVRDLEAPRGTTQGRYQASAGGMFALKRKRFAGSRRRLSC